MITELCDPEQEIDEEYLAQEQYSLRRLMSADFIAKFDGKEKMAALSLATGRYDSVKRDVEKGRLSYGQVTALYFSAIAHKVVTHEMATLQLSRIFTN